MNENEGAAVDRRGPQGNVCEREWPFGPRGAIWSCGGPQLTAGNLKEPRRTAAARGAWGTVRGHWGAIIRLRKFDWWLLLKPPGKVGKGGVGLGQIISGHRSEDASLNLWSLFFHWYTVFLHLWKNCYAVSIFRFSEFKIRVLFTRFPIVILGHVLGHFSFLEGSGEKKSGRGFAKRKPLFGKSLRQTIKNL
jgi:hypothetical protein